MRPQGPLSPRPFPTVLKSSPWQSGKKQKNKRHPDWIEHEASLLADDTILYVENPKEPTETVSAHTLGKVAGPKPDIQKCKSVYFQISEITA